MKSVHYLLCGLCLSLSLYSACSEEGALLVGGDQESEAHMVVSPEGPVTLGFFQEQSFSVVLVDQDGLPMAEQPVFAHVVGNAHNGDLSPSELITDGDGRADVVFTAPDQAADLQIRFSSPASVDLLVPVEVDPEALSVSLVIEYTGQRDFESITASIFPDTNCEILPLDDEALPENTSTLQGADFPVSFSFGGVKAASSYAVEVVAFNETGEPRARACVDNLTPGDVQHSGEILDVELELAGSFALETHIDTGDVLDPIIQEISGISDTFSSDVPDAILNTIRALITDPLAVAQFDETRTSQDLDGLLATDFDDRGVDVEQELEDIWSAAGARLQVVEISSLLELGAADGGAHNFVHWIESLAFNGGMDSAEYQVLFTETGQGQAQVEGGNVDQLLIDDHSLGLGLGGVVFYSALDELQYSQGASSFSSALQTIIDCNAVAEVLSDPLEGVTDSVTIAVGCLDVTLLAEIDLLATVTVVDATYGQLHYDSGECLFSDPLEGYQVTGLYAGEFTMSWCGTECLSPMDATFVGAQVVDAG